MNAVFAAYCYRAERRDERTGFLLGLAISCGVHGIALAATLLLNARDDPTPLPVAASAAPIVARLAPQAVGEAVVLPPPESAAKPPTRNSQPVDRVRKALAPTLPALDIHQPATREASAASAAIASDNSAQAPQIVVALSPAATSTIVSPDTGDPVVPPSFNADYLDNPAPVYPSAARRLREEGRVLLLVDVASDGVPRQVNLAASSGSARLDEAALTAVRQWRFVPARKGTTAVPAQVLVPIVFGLTG